jgi:hypothetical protein
MLLIYVVVLVLPILYVVYLLVPILQDKSFLLHQHHVHHCMPCIVLGFQLAIKIVTKLSKNLSMNLCKSA